MIKDGKRLLLCFGILIYYINGFSDTLHVLNVGQGNAMEWCWVAASKSLCHYYNPGFNKTLKEVASIYTTNTNVCPSRSELGSVLKEILEGNCQNQISRATFKTGVMSQDECIREIDQQRAFIFVIAWNSGGYHNNVCTGYDKANKNKWCFMDPSGSGKKVWRTWGTNGPQVSGGTWFGSLIITKSVGISHGLQKENRPLLTIVHNPIRTGMVSIRVEQVTERASEIGIFNAMGACVHQIPIARMQERTTFSVPFLFGSGTYFVSFTYKNRLGGTERALNSFTIVK